MPLREPFRAIAAIHAARALQQASINAITATNAKISICASPARNGTTSTAQRIAHRIDCNFTDRARARARARAKKKRNSNSNSAAFFIAAVFH
jgi:hypothetical protein